MQTSKEFTALTGLFRSSPMFATATYGRVSVPESPFPPQTSSHTSNRSNMSNRYRIYIGRAHIDGNTLIAETDRLRVFPLGRSPFPEHSSLGDWLQTEVGLPKTAQLMYSNGQTTEVTDVRLTDYSPRHFRLSGLPKNIPQTLQSVSLLL